MKQYIHQDMCLTVYDNGRFWVHPSIWKDIDYESNSIRPNFEVNLAGNPWIVLCKEGFFLDKIIECTQGLELGYNCEKQELYVTIRLEFVPETNVIVQKNTIKNYGKKNCKLTRFSSCFLEHIASDSKENWYDNNELYIYICHSKWMGEGQWRKYKPTELGLYPGSVHGAEKASYRINSIGSWSTAGFYPMTVVEDKKHGNVWYMEIEGSHNWFLQYDAYGGYSNPSLALQASGCDEENGSWHYDLKPGEEYTTPRVFYGVALGGFEEAAENMNAFKRRDSLVHFEQGIPPLVFNDYMDCIWGNQKPEVILPLVERAAEIGCEVFCIDGGWCENVYAEGKSGEYGDWQPKKEFYKDITLQQLAEKIREKGMIPGIWMELETCTRTAYGYGLDDNTVLKRYDTEIVGRGTLFYNFSNEKVKAYLFEKVRALYDMGFRYIKNDYNHSTGIGCTNNYDGDSPAEGLIQNHRNFLQFIYKLYEEFPDLIIENCGSGGLRSDNSMLRHFALQSTSDQEEYENNPSILMGSTALMPPEKAAIWVYPYPTTWANFRNFVPDEAYVKSMKDGLQTSFNMVTGLMGNMLLSGRIDLCDDYNVSLIKDGVDIYKNIRKDLRASRPVYPSGLHKINSRELVSFGLLTEEILRLAVWNVNAGKDNEISIDLSKWLHPESQILNVYPPIKDIKYELCGTELSVKVPTKNSALYLEIKR